MKLNLAIPNSKMRFLARVPLLPIEIERLRACGISFATLDDVYEDELPLLYEIARARLEAGEFCTSGSIFAILAVVDPWNGENWLGLGMSQQLLGEHAAALDALTVAVAISIPDPRPRFFAAFSFLSIGDRERARESFDACLRWCSIDPAYRTLHKDVEYFRDQI